MAGPWPARELRRAEESQGTQGQARYASRSRRAPFIGDPRCNVMVGGAHRPPTLRGPAGSGRVAGLRLGGRLRKVRASLSHLARSGFSFPVSRASRPARSPSGAVASAGRSKRRRVRAVSARLETVQKVVTT